MLRQHRENRSNEKLLSASHAIVRRFLRSETAGDGVLEIDGESLSGNVNKKLKGWREENVEEAQEIVRVARALCQVDESLSSCLCDLLIPFSENFRESFTQQGMISFDGLLARARTLVRDYPVVREELKHSFKAILIDEFQDTDPIQYEILVYLAEDLGQRATDWSKVKLTPGKIFVVGDPKQSIYAFRRADIEAYLQITEKMIKAQNGIECQLVTNFRSHGIILDVVNGVFDRLIQPREGLQPAYVPIQPAPLESDENRSESSLPFRKVTIRKVHGESETLNTESARRLEAENLARWLEEEVLGKTEILDEEGRTVLVQAKHVAILLRKLTDVHHYLEPLRRRGLRYVVEGERHFYAVQEIIDAVNLLRTVENPHDKLALVGVLRSPSHAMGSTVSGCTRLALAARRPSRRGHLRAPSPTAPGLPRRRALQRQQAKAVLRYKGALRTPSKTSSRDSSSSSGGGDSPHLREHTDPSLSSELLPWRAGSS